MIANNEELNEQFAAIPTEYSNEVKASKTLFAVFDTGYKSCIKDALDWLRKRGDDYVWFLEEDGGLTEDLYEDLERYLNGRLEVNDL